MTIDWDKFGEEVDVIAKQSAAQTDEKLASKISSVTRLTDAEIMELFPKPADAQKLVELMRVVQSAEASNVKINRIAANMESFGGIIVTLLGKFV